MKKIAVLLLVLVLIIPTIYINASSPICETPDFEKFEGNPILQPTKPGIDGKKYFDASAVTDPCVVYADGQYHMFYTGWHTWLNGEGSQGYIGYAISSDGKNFLKIEGSAGGVEAPGAVLGPGDNTEFDGKSVFAPSVVYYNGIFWMFYVGKDMSGNTSIGLARSTNGNYWQKLGQTMKPTLESSFDGYQIGSCSVIRDDGKWKMWYAGQSKTDSRWRIGYAISLDTNPISWTKSNGNKTQGAVLDIGSKVTDFDSLCVRNPSVVKQGTCYYMAYDTSMRNEKSSQIGLAVSENGIDWEKRGIVLDMGTVGEFDALIVATPCLIKTGLVFKLYYCNFSDMNSGIGLATTGDMPTNIGSGIFKADCKLGDGFDFSRGNKTTDPTQADLIFDCGYGTPRMCGRFIKMDTDFADAECVPHDGYPAISSIRENCTEIKAGETYAFKTINDENYAIAKITNLWQDPLDPTHWEITIKWKYQANGSNCFIAGSNDPPSRPYNVYCQAGDMNVKITWTCSFAAPGKEIRYYVYRADEEGEAKNSTMPIHDFPVSECQFSDYGLENGKTYYYIVRTVDQYGNLSEASGECFCTPQAVHPPSFPMPPSPGIEGAGTADNPFVVEQNPYTFDWCGFPPQSMVIIQGIQYIADGSGCIHVSLELKDGLNAIDYTVFTPTGEVFNDTVYFEIKDTSIHVEMTIGSKIIYKNDEQILVDAAPYINAQAGRTMVPIRHITEVLGAHVDWDGTQKKVTVITYCGSEILNKMEMWIDKKTYLINGQPGVMDVAPVLNSQLGRTYVPFRFVAEVMGATVGWIDETKTVIYDYTPPSNCP